MKHADCRVRDQRIEELRQQGFANAEIAARLQLKQQIVETVASRLIHERRIEPLKRGRPVRTGVNEERLHLVATLVKRHATLREIGKALGGVTKQYVSKLIQKITALHGKEVFRSDELVWTIPEAARLVGLSRQYVRSLRHAGEVPLCGQKGRTFLLNEEGMRLLRDSAAHRQLHRCVICGEALTFPKRGGQRLVCSERCRAERNAMSHAKLRTGWTGHVPPARSLRGWHCLLRERLQSHIILEDEQWLLLKQASDLFGLSMGQVWWMGQRGIITTKPHPIAWSNRTGQPALSYAASQLRIAREVYKTWQQMQQAEG